MGESNPALIFRKRSGLSRQVAATLAGVSNATLANAERCACLISVKTAKKLARVYKCSVAELRARSLDGAHT